MYEKRYALTKMFLRMVVEQVSPSIMQSSNKDFLSVINL
jgi:hypothetical protein